MAWFPVQTIDVTSEFVNVPVTAPYIRVTTIEGAELFGRGSVYGGFNPIPTDPLTRSGGLFLGSLFAESTEPFLFRLPATPLARVSHYLSIVSVIPPYRPGWRVRIDEWRPAVPEPQGSFTVTGAALEVLQENLFRSTVILGNSTNGEVRVQWGGVPIGLNSPRMTTQQRVLVVDFPLCTQRLTVQSNNNAVLTGAFTVLVM